MTHDKRNFSDGGTWRNDKYWDKLGVGTAHRSLWQAMVLTPPPPCDTCTYRPRCTATSEVCPAYTDYYNLKPWQAGERIPNKHNTTHFQKGSIASLNLTVQQVFDELDEDIESKALTPELCVSTIEP